MTDIDLTGLLLAHKGLGVEYDRLNRVARHLITTRGAR
jgi:hypothetical protein